MFKVFQISNMENFVVLQYNVVVFFNLLKGGFNLINIQDVINNVSMLSKTLPSLNIDSIFIEQDGKIEKYFYKDEQLHELKSCSKLLVAMAIGIAINKKLSISGKPLTLNTKIYPIIKDIVNIF